MTVHPFAPVFREDARVLILGSFPSVRSRREGFYYGHPRNRFWPLMAALFSRPVPVTAAEKTALLTSCGVALWDSAMRCDVTGSADSSLRNAAPNDVASLLRRAPIRRIFANGRTAGALYDRLILPATGVPITVLPSTSPANAAVSFDGLLAAWRAVADACAADPQKETPIRD